MTWMGSSVFNLEASRSEGLMMMLYFFSILPIIAVFISIVAARRVLADRNHVVPKS